jgi:hypothetical protein
MHVATEAIFCEFRLKVGRFIPTVARIINMLLTKRSSRALNAQIDSCGTLFWRVRRGKAIPAQSVLLEV